MVENLNLMLRNSFFQNYLLRLNFEVDNSFVEMLQHSVEGTTRNKFSQAKDG